MKKVLADALEAIGNGIPRSLFESFYTLMRRQLAAVIKTEAGYQDVVDSVLGVVIRCSLPIMSLPPHLHTSFSHRETCGERQDSDSFLSL